MAEQAWPAASSGQLAVQTLAVLGLLLGIECNIRKHFRAMPIDRSPSNSQQQPSTRPAAHTPVPLAVVLEALHPGRIRQQAQRGAQPEIILRHVWLPCTE